MCRLLSLRDDTMIVLLSQTKLPDSSNPLSDIVGAVQIWGSSEWVARNATNGLSTMFFSLSCSKGVFWEWVDCAIKVLLSGRFNHDVSASFSTLNSLHESGNIRCKLYSSLIKGWASFRSAFRVSSSLSQRVISSVLVFTSYSIASISKFIRDILNISLICLMHPLGFLI